MNSKHQISVRLPQALYLSLQDYLGKHEFLTLSQLTTYAIAQHIGYGEFKNEFSSIALELDDLKIDIQDIESLLENLDRRLTKIENEKDDKKLKKSRVPHKLTDSQKQSIIDYAKRSLDSRLIITTKEILYYLGLNPNHQGLQQQVSHILRSRNLMKVRRRVNGKITYLWVE